MKKAGLLLAISSLPSQFGIGDLGESTYEFVDIFKQTDTKIWQVLLLTPLGFGNSPHQCSSSFASDEIYIAVDKLVEISLLDSKDLHHFNVDTGIIEYYAVRGHKNQYLKKAFGNFNKSQNSELKSAYQKFVTENDWVKILCYLLKLLERLMITKLGISGLKIIKVGLKKEL